MIGGTAPIGENIWTASKQFSTGLKSIDCREVVSGWQSKQIVLSPSDIQRAWSLWSLFFVGLAFFPGRTLSLLLFIVTTLDSIVGLAPLNDPFWSRLIRWRLSSTQNAASGLAALLRGRGGFEIWSSFLCCDLLVDDGQVTSNFGMIIWLGSGSGFSSDETSLATVELLSWADSVGPGLCGAS